MARYVCMGIGELSEAIASTTDLLAVVSVGLDELEAVPDCLSGLDVPVLRLRFDDTRDPFDTLAPTEDDVRTAAEFMGRYVDTDGTVIVHCFAGIGRSAALVIVANWLRWGSPTRACDEMFRIRSFAKPNPVVLAHADRIFGADLSTPTADRVRRPDLVLKVTDRRKVR